MRLIETTQELARICNRLRSARLRGCRYGIHSRADLLAQAVPDPARRPRRRRAGRPPAPRHLARSLLPADGKPAGGEGVPRGAAGPGDHLEPGAAHPASDLRHPGRGHGVRLRRGRELRQPRQAGHAPRPRQDLPLHGLGEATAVAQAAHLRAGRRHPPARHLPLSQGGAGAGRPGRLARRGDGDADRAGHLRGQSRAGLAAPQAARQEPQGPGCPDRAGSVARAGGAGPGRAAQPHPARRDAVRHRQSRADGSLAAVRAAHAERRLRQVGARQGNRRGGQAGPRARSQDRASPAHGPASAGRQAGAASICCACCSRPARRATRWRRA